jgi:nicotinamidase-related amidase
MTSVSADFKHALLCIDVHESYSSLNPRTTRLIREFAKRARKDMLVVWVRMETMGGRRWPQWQDAPFVISKDIPDTAFNPASAGDYGMCKYSASAFSNRHLLPFLKKKNVQDVWICGFQTSTCPALTALAAKKDFNAHLLLPLTAQTNDQAPPGVLIDLRLHGVDIALIEHAEETVGIPRLPAPEAALRLP